MRLSKLAGVLGTAIVVVLWTTTPAAAVDIVVVPMKVPPGGPVHIDVSACPVGTTDSVAVRIRPDDASPPPFDPADPGLLVTPATDGAATFDFRLPIDLTPGAHAFDAFCVSEGGAVVDGPQSVPVEVAFLPLTVNPPSGPVGTQITVSGSGCPTGVTDQVFVRIEGASDDIAPFDPGSPSQVSTTPAADGSFSVSFAVPSDLTIGETSLFAFCVSEGGTPLAGPALAGFVVTETPELARTGGAPVLPAAVGLAMLLTGGAVLLRLSRFARRST